ncbi:MAG: CPBP family intramembrane glutamic endopeptidase [Candidatus Treponema excrementipullorum]|nr:CPBP family intramembrane glutamic endopeptidase [Candidatus Treponema excrementipullorum]
MKVLIFHQNKKSFFFLRRLSLLFCLKKRCSGALYKIILWKILKKKDVSPWRALCIASAIFGAVHILNLLGRPYFVLGTVTQVIYTFCVGIIIGTVYWSSKNIWSCFLLHYIFNALGGYSDLFVEKTTEAVTASSTGTDIGFLSAAIQLLIMLPCIPIAWLIYKQAIKKH